MLKTVITFVLSNVIVLFMFSAGLAARRGGVRQIFQRPALYGRALAVVLVGVPLLAFALVRLFRLPSAVAAAIVLTAISPGAPLLVKQAKSLSANVTLALNLLLLLALCTLITVPFWVSVMDRVMGFELHASPGMVLRTMLVKVVPPLVVGMAVQRLAPRAAEVLAVWTSRLFNVLLVVALVLLLVKAPPRLGELGGATVLALFLLVSASAFLGHWAGGPRLEDRKAVALTAGLAPPALALTIIINSYPNLRALHVAAGVAAIVIVRVLALIPYKVWAKRQDRKEHAERLPPGSVPQ